MPNILNNLMHVARIYTAGGVWRWLYLRKSAQGHYIWTAVDGEGQESDTPISADSAEEAIRLARRHWIDEFFDTLRCGFRFTLPERDEIGSNALFHQMVSSYSTMNGVYLDEELGHQCIVHDASQEALDLWKRLVDSSQ